jgi:hypothetical protein
MVAFRSPKPPVKVRVLAHLHFGSAHCERLAALKPVKSFVWCASSILVTSAGNMIKKDNGWVRSSCVQSNEEPPEVVKIPEAVSGNLTQSYYWEFIKLEESHEIGIVLVLKTSRRVKLACRFEPDFLRKEYEQQIKRLKNKLETCYSDSNSQIVFWTGR